MPVDKWIVLIAGAGAIVWLNWHFIASTRRARATGTSPNGTQVVVVRANGLFDPQEVRVRTGVPVRIVFERTGAMAGIDEVVIAALGIRCSLAARGRTSVELAALQAGQYPIESGSGGLLCTLIAVQDLG